MARRSALMNPAAVGRAAVLLALALTGACSYGHPATGVFGPGVDSELPDDDTSNLALLAAAQGSVIAADTDTNTTTPPIYLFKASTLTPTGDLRNGQPTAREGADLRCQTSPPALPVSCGEIRAMISLTATDEIRDMEANYGIPASQPVYPPGGESLRLAASWTDLLDTVTTDLITAPFGTVCSSSGQLLCVCVTP